jgi:hypothetical protein
MNRLFNTALIPMAMFALAIAAALLFVWSGSA